MYGEVFESVVDMLCLGVLGVGGGAGYCRGCSLCIDMQNEC